MTALMSRTDKTQPWRVKALFYPSYVKEHHDHRKHACNLPPKATVDNVDWWHGEDCGWIYSNKFTDSAWTNCTCGVCDYDPYYEVPKRKRDRLAAKRYTQSGWRKEY